MIAIGEWKIAKMYDASDAQASKSKLPLSSAAASIPDESKAVLQHLV
jgi:hypothetical protein